MSETGPSIMTQSWPWGGQIAAKKLSVKARIFNWVVSLIVFRNRTAFFKNTCEWLEMCIVISETSPPSKMELFAKLVNYLNLLIFFTKTLFLRWLAGFWMHLWYSTYNPEATKPKLIVLETIRMSSPFAQLRLCVHMVHVKHANW